MAYNPATISLSAAAEQAAIFLATPLTKVYHSETIVNLQSALTIALFHHCASTWNVQDPTAGACRRMLSFAPATSPARALYNAAKSAGVDPALWIELLTHTSGPFDLSLNPGFVSVSDPATGRLRPVWTAQTPQRPQKTFAQLIDAQESGDDLLALIGSQSPDSPDAGWFDHTLSCFPSPPVAVSPAAPSPARPDSRSSTHSRSSSFSSLSSASGASFSSVGSDDSASTASSSQSRRDRNRSSKVFIDPTKKEVTPYDGGKTTVLTGGVMLGAKPTTPKASATSFSQSWRRF